MAKITAVLPPDLLQKIRMQVDPNEAAAIAVGCAIQSVLPAAATNYSEKSSELTIEIEDDALIKSLVDIALLQPVPNISGSA